VTASSRLLERDEVFSAIERSGRSAASGAGRLLLVEASAGLGKTSVLAVAAERLAAAGFRVLRARGAGLERGFAFGIVHQLFGRTAADPELRHRLFRGVAAMAAGLFGVPEAADGADPGDIAPFAMTHALYWVAANLCRSGPVAVLVDDVHEADEASLEFLAFLARRRADMPVLIMMAARLAEKGQPGQRLDELRWEADTVVQLEPLSDGAIVSLCRRAEQGDRWNDEVVTAVARATGGNPFYAGELLRDLGSRGAVSGDDAGWVSRVRPPAIVRSVLSRMASLPAGSVDLARAYAVLGEGARMTDCAALAGVPASEAARLADELAAAGILAKGGTGFAHPIVETAVLADVGDHALRQWHDRAARLLAARGSDPQRVALHLLHCEPADDPGRVTTLRSAARAVARTGTPSAVAEYLRRALAEPSSAQARPDILFDLGLAEFALADPAALDHVREAVATTSDNGGRAVRSLLSADLHMTAGQAHAGVLQLDAVLASAAGTLDDDLALRLEVKRRWLQLFDPATLPGDLSRPDDLSVRCRRPDSLAQRELLAFLVVEASNSGFRAGAEALLRQALAPPGITAFIGAESTDAVWLLNCLHALEFHDEFDILAETMRAEASRKGNALAYAGVGLSTARQFLRFGDLRTAESELQAAAEAAELASWPLLSLAFCSLRGTILLAQGRVDEAHAAVAALPASSYDGARTYTEALLVDLRGQLRCQRGDTAAGLDDLRRSGALFERLGFANPGHMDWRGHLARAYLRAGQPAAARRIAGEEVAHARRLSGPITLAATLHTFATTITDADEQLAVLDEARQLAEGSRGRLVRAGILVELGAAGRRRGQRVAAREHLQRGLDLATECGAAGLAERARDEFLAAGARPRRARFSGLESLTPSEARVARLAAAGHSNAEIAQTLFVTNKTVESHLAAAYRKLGVRSRAELPAFRG
jgi:DNA-binding CsgD family transcriptional regulator